MIEATILIIIHGALCTASIRIDTTKDGGPICPLCHGSSFFDDGVWLYCDNGHFAYDLKRLETLCSTKQ